MKRIMSALLAAASACLLMVVLGQTAEAATNVYYRNAQYQQCMDLANGSFNNGTPIGRTPYCGDGALNRQWYIEGQGERNGCLFPSPDIPALCIPQNQGAVQVFRIHSALTGKCVDINRGGTSSGETINQQDCSSNASQLWYFLRDPVQNDNRFYMVSYHVFNRTGVTRVIDSGPTYPLRIWSYNASGAQQWFFDAA